MNPTVVRLAPTALVLAVGGYTVWPYLGPDAPGPAPPAAAAAAKPKDDKGAPVLTTALLEPRPVPPPARDPFDDPEVGRARFRDAVRRRLSELNKQLTERGKWARPKPVARARPGAAGGFDADPLAGMTLHATYIHGSQSGAVIDGRVVAVGQPLRPPDPQGPPPPVLKEVRPHSVVITVQGQDHELKYPPLGRAPAARAARPAAKRPTGRTPKTAAR